LPRALKSLENEVSTKDDEDEDGDGDDEDEDEFEDDDEEEMLLRLAIVHHVALPTELRGRL
jgi:hypothetical protein